MLLSTDYLVMSEHLTDSPGLPESIKYDFFFYLQFKIWMITALLFEQDTAINDRGMLVWLMVGIEGNISHGTSVDKNLKSHLQFSLKNRKPVLTGSPHSSTLV